MQKSGTNKNYSASTQPDSMDLTVPHDCAGLRLDQVLARLLPEHSRSRLTQWVREARVSVNGSAAQPRAKMWGGERLHVQPASSREALAYLPQDIPLQVIYEDAALLVIDKQPGLVVHPGSGNWEGTLLNALLMHAPGTAAIPRAGIVHRLDKDTSGLLVVAKTLTAQTDLVRQLQARTVRREYTAIVHGRVERDGKVEAPIGRHPAARTRMAVVPRGKAALTHYTVVARYADATRLHCRLETGRTHQIRVHLASIGHALLGDPVYGPRPGRTKVRVFSRQALHAQKLGLIHPVSGREMSWEAPLPEDMRELIATLEAAA
jgi:23S rRNA pseudouridine1911/1915/1917 synthase